MLAESGQGESTMLPCQATYCDPNTPLPWITNTNVGSVGENHQVAGGGGCGQHWSDALEGLGNAQDSHQGDALTWSTAPGAHLSQSLLTLGIARCNQGLLGLLDEHGRALHHVPR